MGRHFEVRAASMQKTAAAKTKIYSRYGREIYLAAKSGVADPEMNLELKRKIAEAKSNQVPSHVIQNAIDKAKGGSAENYDSARYEGFGPKEATIIVDCLTDNLNRSLSDVRTAFNRTHMKMGVNGSVSFLYDNYGQFTFRSDSDGEDILEAMLMADVDVKDLEAEDGYVTIFVEPTQFGEARSVLDSIRGEDAEYEINELTLVPQVTCELTEPEDVESFKKLLAMLDDLEDVQKVYHNVTNLE